MSDVLKIGSHQFTVKVAITEEEQIQGLMKVAWPPPIMIFPFEKAAVRKFWMKDTISPLDLIFCLDNEIVFICQGEPLSLDFLGPNISTDMVIEMPKGYVQKFGIAVKDKIKVKYSVYTVAKKLTEKTLKIGA